MVVSYKPEMEVFHSLSGGWRSLAQQPRHTCPRRALPVMAARQVRSKRAPPSQQGSSEPPIFIPLDTPVRREQQPVTPQHTEAVRSQQALRKEPVARHSQDEFRNQRKEVHEGRRAFQEQREALGLKISFTRSPERQTQAHAPATEPSTKELRQSMRDVYFDMEAEGEFASSSGSEKAPKAKRSNQQPPSRMSVGQDESAREGSAERRSISTRRSLRDEEQPANSSRKFEGSLGGARAGRGSESRFERDPRAAQQGAGFRQRSQPDRHSPRGERDRQRDDAPQNGRSQSRRHGSQEGTDVTETGRQVYAEADVSTPIVRRGTGSTATFFTKDTFRDIGASDEMVQALLGMGIGRPSHIQAAAYRALSEDSSYVVLADHAGSGKTLAYLLPLVQRMREEEKSVCNSLTMRNSPRVIVLAPTTELCAQVLTVARSLAKGAPFRCIVLTGGFPWRTQKEALDEGVDLVVATPGRLGEHIKAGTLKLHQCQAIVMDEADVLLGDAYAFSAQIAPLRAACPPTTRFVMVTATLAASVFAQLMQEFPGILPAFGPGLHRTAPGVTEQLVDCSGGDVKDEETGFARKAEALTRVMGNESALRTIVFCNKIETCRKVENVLKRTSPQNEQGILVLPYHAAIEEGQRVKNLKMFLAPPMQAKPMVLVCTDRASRGIDSAYVEHVVLFDFPRDPSEYVRRAGRVSRGAGGSGLVSILVLGRQVQVAKQLLERNKKGLPIHSVPVAIA